MANKLPNADDSLDRFKRAAFAATRQWLLDVGTDLEAQGVKNAPVRYGDLRRSIIRDNDVTVASVKGGLVQTIAVNAFRVYAWLQHERLDFKHPKGGRARYLAAPAEERRSRYMKLLERQLNAAAREAAKA